MLYYSALHCVQETSNTALDTFLHCTLVAIWQIRIMLMSRIAVRALELILCRLRSMLQAHLFIHLACHQEPPQTAQNGYQFYWGKKRTKRYPQSGANAPTVGANVPTEPQNL